MLCTSGHWQFPILSSDGIDVFSPRTQIPLWPLILECALANHPDKAFIQQLISNFLHGCAIGYNGPQFASNAKHLSSALQLPMVIDDSL